jgi:hypothetical protein
VIGGLACRRRPRVRTPRQRRRAHHLRRQTTSDQNYLARHIEMASSFVLRHSLAATKRPLVPLQLGTFRATQRSSGHTDTSSSPLLPLSRTQTSPHVTNTQQHAVQPPNLLMFPVAVRVLPHSSNTSLAPQAPHPSFSLTFRRN